MIVDSYPRIPQVAVHNDGGARQVLGFNPAHSWRDHVSGEAAG